MKIYKASFLLQLLIFSLFFLGFLFGLIFVSSRLTILIFPNRSFQDSSGLFFICYFIFVALLISLYTLRISLYRLRHSPKNIFGTFVSSFLLALLLAISIILNFMAFSQLKPAFSQVEDERKSILDKIHSISKLLNKLDDFARSELSSIEIEKERDAIFLSLKRLKLAMVDGFNGQCGINDAVRRELRSLKKYFPTIVSDPISLSDTNCIESRDKNLRDADQFISLVKKMVADSKEFGGSNQFLLDEIKSNLIQYKNDLVKFENIALSRELSKIENDAFETKIGSMKVNLHLLVKKIKTVSNSPGTSRNFIIDTNLFDNVPPGKAINISRKEIFYFVFFAIIVDFFISGFLSGWGTVLIPLHLGKYSDRNLSSAFLWLSPKNISIHRSSPPKDLMHRFLWNPPIQYK